MSTENQAQENKMGVMPENRLLLTMAIPIVISMLVQALYNVVDSVFVAQLSEDALNAVSLAFPVQNLMIAVAVGTGVGINALLSKSLGEGNQAKADRTAMNGLFLSALSFLVFAVIGLTCSRLYFTIQTDIQRIVDYGESYMMICCVCSFGVFFQITLERTLQATGRTLYTMFTQATGAIINIILDPIMIFGLFGFPRMEVAGAALATVTGQIVAAILGLFFNLKKNPDLHLSVRGFRPSRTIIGGIYSVGIPSIVMQSIGSVMVFGMNQILIAFTQTATAVFGVYFKLQSFIFMPVFGLNNGMVPIVAYNYGARKPARIMKTIRLSVCYAVGIMLVGLLIFQFASPRCCGSSSPGRVPPAICCASECRHCVSFLTAFCLQATVSWPLPYSRHWGTACSVWWSLLSGSFSYCFQWLSCSPGSAGWTGSGGPSPSRSWWR